MVDNYDSFSYTIVDYLRQCGVVVDIKKRDELEVSDIHLFDGIVFSPGPGNPEKLQFLMDLVSESVKWKPTLGICLGFQAIAYYFGSRIRKGMPVHGKLSTVFTIEKGRLTEGLPDKFEVVRYHSLFVDLDSSPLKALLQTSNNEIMAFEHPDLPVMAVQFHPEAYLSQFGIHIFQNWLKFC